MPSSLRRRNVRRTARRPRLRARSYTSPFCVPRRPSRHGGSDEPPEHLTMPAGSVRRIEQYGREQFVAIPLPGCPFGTVRSRRSSITAVRDVARLRTVGVAIRTNESVDGRLVAVTLSTCQPSSGRAVARASPRRARRAVGGAGPLARRTAWPVSAQQEHRALNTPAPKRRALLLVDRRDAGPADVGEH
jgi:hypothetical protein